MHLKQLFQSNHLVRTTRTHQRHNSMNPPSIADTPSAIRHPQTHQAVRNEVSTMSSEKDLGEGALGDSPVATLSAVEISHPMVQTAFEKFQLRSSKFLYPTSSCYSPVADY